MVLQREVVRDVSQKMLASCGEAGQELELGLTGVLRDLGDK